MLVSQNLPVNGMKAPGAGGAFGRLVGLYQSNVYLSSELKSVREKLGQAQAYLGTPGCNPVLGEAYVLRLRARHSAALALLRANRLQAREALARVGGGPGAATGQVRFSAIV